MTRIFYLTFFLASRVPVLRPCTYKAEPPWKPNNALIFHWHISSANKVHCSYQSQVSAGREKNFWMWEAETARIYVNSEKKKTAPWTQRQAINTCWMNSLRNWSSVSWVDPWPIHTPNPPTCLLWTEVCLFLPSLSPKHSEILKEMC